jgi:hypothetical protein
MESVTLCHQQRQAIPYRCTDLAILCWSLNLVMILIMLFFGRRCCLIDTLFAQIRRESRHTFLTEEPLHREQVRGFLHAFSVHTKRDLFE